MAPTRLLIAKDLRQAWRDPRALVVLLLMPLLLVAVLGLSVGEGFGQKADDRLRISIVDLDEGYTAADELAAASTEHQPIVYHWNQTIEHDLAATAGIRVELIKTQEEADDLIARGRRAAVLVLGPKFSERVTKCSFLPNGVNPFFRDGVAVERLDARLLTDPTQLTASSIIEQVAQVTTLRVVMPWMIGRAFDMIGRRLGSLVQVGLKQMFPNYDLTATTWAGLTRSKPKEGTGQDGAMSTYEPPASGGLLNRGAMRYQILVPSYLVMFAFFLVLVVGRLFVAERKQGTLKRLRAAPLAQWQILLGKFVPAYIMSIVQGVFLLVAGKLVFAMSWGPQPLWLLPVVLSTSLAAMGLALVVAAMDKTESQVVVYGTLLVLALAGLSGSLMGDRALMPTAMQQISLLTPHAWALDAYRQLLANPGEPNLQIVTQACAVLTAYGAGLVMLGWWLLWLRRAD